MKYLGWLLKAALFFAVFAFAVNNQAVVSVRLFFGHSFEAPLVITLFITLLIGVVLGVLIMVPLWMKAKKRRHETPPEVPQPSPEDHGI